MATSFTSLLESEPFVILVGQTKKSLTIHAALVKELSEPLDKLIHNGAMKESNEKVAGFENVDVETFSHFAEYCYTKNYRAIPGEATNYKGAVQGTEVVGDVPVSKGAFHGTEVVEGVPVFNGTTCFSYQPLRYPKRGSSCHSCRREYLVDSGNYCSDCFLQVKRDLWDKFKSKTFGSIGLTHDDLRKHLDNMCPRDEVTAKVTQHAKLFVFADQYLVQPLKDLCMHKLHRDLLEYDVEESGVAEIVDLLAYVYNNTSPEPEGGGSGFDLRDLVMTFAACKAEKLVDDEAFIAMLEDGTEVSSAFARYVVKRLA